MTFTVDEKAIRDRIKWHRMESFDAADLQVHLDGVNRRWAAATVSATLAAAPSHANWTVAGAIEPTANGLCVTIEPASQWQAVVGYLVDQLGSFGLTGQITAPRSFESLSQLSQLPAPPPTGFVRVRLRKPLEQGERYNDGGFSSYWGLSHADSKVAFDHSTTWAAHAGDVGNISRGGPELPATADDAADLVHRRLVGNRQMDAMLTFTKDATDPRRRARVVHYSRWGQLSYADIDPTHDPVETAEALLQTLLELAPILDTLMIRPSSVGQALWTNTNTYWPKAAHLWASFVPDVAGAQVLSTHQLNRANDLSRWIVEPISADRWLVRATDLRPWITIRDGVTTRPGQTWKPDDVVDPHVLHRARAVFGRLIFDVQDLLKSPRPTSRRNLNEPEDGHDR